MVSYYIKTLFLLTTEVRFFFKTNERNCGRSHQTMKFDPFKMANV
jgi:hypothetical protein